MKAHEMSGREFLDSMHDKGEAMCLSESDTSTYRRRRELDVEDARRGQYNLPSPVEIDADLQLETMSAVMGLRATVSRQWSSIVELERMVRFLVERVDGPQARVLTPTEQPR